MQERGEARPDPGQNEGLGAGIGMEPVGLHVAAVGGDPGKEERDPGDAGGSGRALEGGGERPLVERPVIGRKTHAEKEHAGVGTTGARDHGAQVGREDRGGKRAQAVVPAELEDQKERVPAGEETGKTRASLGRSFPAHARVHDPHARIPLREAAAEEIDPGHAAREAVAGAQAVAKNEDRASRERGRPRGGASGSEGYTHGDDHQRRGHPTHAMNAACDRCGLLRLEDVSHGYSGNEETASILEGVSLTLERGERAALLGVSGSGKTTLLAVASGLEPPRAGRVRFLDRDLYALDENRRAALRLAHLGFVFQDIQLFPLLDVLENVRLPLAFRGDADAEERAREALEAVGLARRARVRPSALSGGEQQRVAVARAFALRPLLLVADEPTARLDRGHARRVWDLLTGLGRERGTALLVATHDEALATDCATRYRLEGGRLRNA